MTGRREVAMGAGSCPETDRILVLLGRALSDEEEAELARHLDGCADCRRRLDDLGDGQTLPDPGERFIGQVQQGVGTGPRGAEPRTARAPAFDFLDPIEKPGHIGRLGKFEVIKVIGRGGMGVVLMARDHDLHRVVAIKVMAPQLAVSTTARKRFIREAQAAAAIHHDNVVTIYAIGKTKGLPYLVMEYIGGPSLQERIKRTGGPLALKEILQIGMQVASGLAAAHAQGLVHRDIKPANILLENGVPRVKITDFGVVKAADMAGLSVSGERIGTPEYMAPEQARGQAVTSQTDLFSLGSVLYAVCTGRSPFRGADDIATLRRVCEDKPQSIKQINPEIPTRLVKVIKRLHAKAPEGRFETAAEVAEALRKLLVEGPKPVGPPSVRARLGALALGAVLGALGLAVLSMARRTPPDRDGAAAPVRDAGIIRPGPLQSEAAGAPRPEAIAAPRPWRHRVLFVIAHRGYWADDLNAMRERLEQNQVQVVVASTALDPAKSASKEGVVQRVNPDILLDRADASHFDAVIFGGGGIDAYRGDTQGGAGARKLLEAMGASQKPIVALCHGVAILADAGVLQGRCVACPSELRPQIDESGATVAPQPVAVDDRILTARSAGDADRLVKELLRLLDQGAS
jgi:putative intracellular protease/amidase